MTGKIKVIVRPMGGKARAVTVGENTQVRDILDKAGFDVGSDTSIVANGETVRPYDTIGEHRELMLVPTVKGGR